MKTPDFTPQAVAGFIILIFTNVLILCGLDIGAKRESALEAIVNAVAIAAFLIHDAIVRHGRAKVAAAALDAGTPLATVLPGRATRV
jgi:hypothetical protein